MSSGNGTSLPGQRPATRIGRTVLFPGGAVVRLSLWAWALHALGVRSHLSTRTKRKES